MPSCAVSTCRNSSSTVGNSGIIFHPFPREDKRSLEWFMKCKRRDKKKANSTDRICSIHFEDCYYERDFGHELLGKPPNPKLKVTATPTINMPYIFIKPSDARKVLTPTLARQLNKRSSQPAKSPNKVQMRKSIPLNNENVPGEGIPTGELRRSLKCPKLPTVKEEEITNSSSDNTVHLASKSHCEDLLSEIFNDESLMDLTISVDQKRIRAHRVVLQQASGYFRRSLMNEDVSSSSEYLLRLHNISYEDMSRLMAFIYHGEVSVEASDLDRFLKATEFLEVQNLKSLATTHTSKHDETSSTNDPSSKKSYEENTDHSNANSKKHKSERSFKKRPKNEAPHKHQHSKKKVIKVVLAELRQGLVATLFLLY